MDCSNYHSTKQDPACPFCLLRSLARALERADPLAPALTVYQDFQARHRKRECDRCHGLGIHPATHNPSAIDECKTCFATGYV